MGALSRQIPNEMPKKVKITCLHNLDNDAGIIVWKSPGGPNEMELTSHQSNIFRLQ